MSTADAERWVKFLKEHAPTLRASGVRHLKLEGCEVDFDPAEVEMPAATKSDPTEPDPPLFHDSHTYGIMNRDGARIPGYPRREDG
jgi:hypothetical protein